MRAVIVSLRYLEPSWEQTKQSIESCNNRVHYVDRNPAGVGNMAEAYNRGFGEVTDRPDYVWFVSNVIFQPDLLSKLVTAMDENPRYAAIHPAFNSDHFFCQPNNTSGVTPVPFVEFTAPIVRADVFEKFPLDRTMPYWGHDLDWGYRVWSAGHCIGVLQGDKPLVDHVYIRNTDRKPGDVTSLRHQRRISTNVVTRRQLVKKYGANYASLIFPKTVGELNRWKQQNPNYKYPG